MSRGGHKESVVLGGSTVRLSSVASETMTTSGAWRGPEVVLYDGPATHFRYAAPLAPSQYRVELLPLRSYEESTSMSAGRDKDAATAGGSGTGGAAGGKRPKASNAGTGTAATSAKGGGGGSGPAAASLASGSSPSTSASSGGGGVASGAGAVSLVGSSTLSYPLTTAECDGFVWPLQAPLLEAMKVWDSATPMARPLRGEHRMKFRASYQTYFEAAAAVKATAVSQSSTEVLEPAVRPVVYHSLLGIKEEDVSVALKSKKSTAVV